MRIIEQVYTVYLHVSPKDKDRDMSAILRDAINTGLLPEDQAALAEIKQVKYKKDGSAL